MLVNSLYAQMTPKQADSMWLKYHPELNKLSPLNYDSVQIYYAKMFNNYRVSQGLKALQIDNLLKPVADDQLNYVSKLGKLSHVQPDKNKKTSLDRCKFYGLNPVFVGENLISNTYYKYNYYSEIMNKYKSNSVSYMLALNMFERWKNSPGHNENMLRDYWTKFYFDIKLVEIDGQTFLYGIQLFEEIK